eukprot:145621-Amphidinium_carterae.1
MSNRSEVLKLVQKDAVFCPKPIQHEKMQSLRERSLLTATAATTTTDTLSLVCRCRERFGKATFGLRIDNEMLWARCGLFKTLLFQNPLRMLALPLTLVDRDAWPPHFGFKGLREQGHTDFTHVWKYDFEDVLQDDIFALTGLEEVVVCLDTVMTSGFYMASYSAPVPLRVVLEACSAEIPARTPAVRSRDPDSKRQKTHRSAQASSSSATHAIACKSSSTSQSASDGSGSDSDDTVRTGLEGEGDESAIMWKTVYEGIREEKDKWQVEAATLLSYFTASLQGGKWSIERSGRAIDGLRGFVQKGSPMDEFCGLFALPKSSSF